MIRAIIFDYGNVISRVDHSTFLNRIVPLSSDPARAMQTIARRQPDLLVEYESGRTTSEDFYLRAAQEYGLSVSQADFKAAFIDIFDRIQPTIELIKKLKPCYKIALLSNTNEWHYKAEIERMEAFHLFDTTTLSFEVGAMKPDERIYSDALRKLALPPDACVYIDDISEYVDAAKRLGMNAIHYTSPDNLLDALGAVGVKI